MRSRVLQKILMGLELTLPHVESLPRRWASFTPLKVQRGFSDFLTWEMRI